MRAVANSLLDDLRNRGVDVRVRGDRLIVDAPRGVLSDYDRAALSTTKPLLVERLALETKLLDMSLEEFGSEGFSIQIRVPWLDETLWWVPRSEHVDILVQQGVSRGRVYTSSELTNLTNLLDAGAESPDVQGIARLRLTLDATIVGVEEAAEPPAVSVPPPTVADECRTCQGLRFWRSIYGQVICGICHPPAHPGVVAEWLDPVAAPPGAITQR